MACLRALLLVVLMMVPAAARAGGEASCPSEAFAQRIARGLAAEADVVDIPGTSVGIVHRGRLVHVAAQGHANRSEGTHATSATLYNLASLTKPFTATLALMMAEAGELDLDAPISSYLAPDMRVPTDAAGAPITIRHLLSHTSGLPRDPPNRRNQDTHSPLDPGIWEAYSLADLKAALPVTPLGTKVGESFLYSNYGYALLGHVLERVAGKPYETLLRERLLDPLGMSDTAITLTPDQQSRLAAHYWTEDPARREQATRARFGEVAAFIGLTSSVDDLSKFAAAHLGGGAGNPVSPALAAKMREVAVEVEQYGPDRYQMTLGWHRMTRVDDDTELFMHLGEVDGHTSGLFLMPEHALAVIVLQALGGDEGSDATERIGRWLLRIAVPELARCPP